MKRSIRTATLLAVAALSVVALAAPATASAVEWKHEGEPLSENAEATFEGQLTFTGKLFTMSCLTTIDTTLEPAGAGTVDVFDFHFPMGNCTGGGILLSGCSLTSILMEPKELPWLFTPKSTSEIELGGVRLYSHLVGCTIGPFEQTLEGDLVAFPDSSEGISSISFKGLESGLLTSSVGSEVTASGTLQATFGSEGAYGIG